MEELKSKAAGLKEETQKKDALELKELKGKQGAPNLRKLLFFKHLRPMNLPVPGPFFYME